MLAEQLTTAGVTAPEIVEFVGDESPFIEAGIPVGGDAKKKTAQQAKAWGGQAGEVYDRCYHQACDRLDNVNRDVLEHYLRAVAGTLASRRPRRSCADRPCATAAGSGRIAPG